MTDPSLVPYAGSSGHVDRDASEQRAVRERDSGVVSERAFTVLTELKLRGLSGGTWQELGSVLGLHHGQISGCLSVLHKAGRVFTTRAQRGRCHVYVHADFRYFYAATQRHDQPAVTKSTARREALEQVLLAAELVCRFDGTDRDSLEALRAAVWQVRNG
jgi:hypothetical protein